MNIQDLLNKTTSNEFLSAQEGLFLFENAALSDLIYYANEMRKKNRHDGKVTWIIDRNVNITNVCISGCKFCNFYSSEKSSRAYITTIEEYKLKIDEMMIIGGNQLLLQGGCHPGLGLEFYTNLFKELKSLYPALKLHALGPAEVAHISKMEGIGFTETLISLKEAGLDSLPGAGAEILSDRVRSFVSPNKCNTQEWLDVMRAAHKLNITTSATMMFGHYENLIERMEHLVLLRNVQSEKPSTSKGFVAFIPWPFQDKDTALSKHHNIHANATPIEYLRMIAISRLMLPNIPNIQASWLTVGYPVAQICLHSGANDFGSIMIEENVVSVAGATYTSDKERMMTAIRDAGFKPQLRNQEYDYC